jgi:hypothetical protein
VTARVPSGKIFATSSNRTPAKRNPLVTANAASY